MPRIHAFSSNPTIQSLGSNSWRNDFFDQSLNFRSWNSWPIWISNCNSITNDTKRTSYGFDFQRKESVRGWSSNSQCRTQIHCRITLWTSESRRRKILLGTVEDQHQGNLCGHPQHFSQPSVFFHTKNHSYDREEVDSYSFQFFVWRSSVNGGLQNGYKNGASLRPRWTTIWRSTSLDTIRPVLLKAFAKHGAQNLSEKHWLRLTHEGSSKFLGLLSSNSRTHWWNSNWPWVDGVHSDSLHLERVYFSQGLSFQHSLCPWEWTDSGWTWKRQRTPLNPFWWRFRLRRTSWWSHSSSKSALSQSLETQSRCRLVEKIIPSTRSRFAILANAVTCNHRTQSCASRLHPQSNLSKRRSNAVGETLNPTTRAESHIEKQCAFAAAPAAACLWWCDWYKETCAGEPIWDKRRERLHNGWSTWHKENCAGSWASFWENATIRNWSSSRRSFSRCYLTTWWEVERNQWKVGKVVKMDQALNPFVTIWRKRVIWSSVKNQVAPSKRWATWSWSNWDKVRRLFSVFLAWQEPEGLNMCECGVWLRPNQSTMDRIRTAFAALKTPYCRASVVISRGKKSGHNPWQMDHQKAIDAKRGARRRGKYTSILDRWKKDEVFRASKLVHGWTDEWV